jgi:hypothetical protein
MGCHEAALGKLICGNHTPPGQSFKGVIRWDRLVSLWNADGVRGVEEDSADHTLLATSSELPCHSAPNERSPQARWPLLRRRLSRVLAGRPSRGYSY